MQKHNIGPEKHDTGEADRPPHLQIAVCAVLVVVVLSKVLARGELLPPFGFAHQP